MTYPYSRVPGLRGNHLGWSNWAKFEADESDGSAALGAPEGTQPDIAHVGARRRVGDTYELRLTPAGLARHWSELLEVDGARVDCPRPFQSVRARSPIEVGTPISVSALVLEVNKVPSGYELTVEHDVLVQDGLRQVMSARAVYLVHN